MLSPLHALALLALGAAVSGSSAASPPRAVASYLLPDSLPGVDTPAAYALVTQQLAALGISQYVPPGAQEAKDGKLWSLLVPNHKQIDLVWTTGSTAPPLDTLSFPTTFSAKINYLPGSQLRLTDGDAFYQHIVKNQLTKEKFNFNFVPNYLVLPRDQTEMPKVFAATAKRVEYEMKREDDANIYQRFRVRELPASGAEDALKPASIIANNDELQSTINSKFSGKDVEVTQYIEPYLIDGHKFQAGFYVAITSIDPLRIYYYSHPQIKIAKKPYPTRLDTSTPVSAYNFDDFIAPWDFPDLQRLYYEFPSADRAGSNSWAVLKRYMMMQGLDTTRLQKEIDAAIVTSVISSRGFLQSEVAKLKRATATEDEHAEQTDLEKSFFQLLRFDFELDDSGKPWLTRVHSDPSMAPRQTTVGTDEAIKKDLLFDLINLVGVHPQAKPSFDKFFKSPDAKFCAQKCTDDSRTWDTTCWTCPGWFAPYVAHRLYDSMSEYSRRGGFKLVYPSLDQDYSKFLDNTMSEHDNAFNRYVKSLSAANAEKQDVPVFDRTVTCVYRDHCSSNGDCVNGKCVCDEEYEGATCYVPKDLEREQRLSENRAIAAARANDGWLGNMWNRAPEPALAAEANRAPEDDGARAPEDAAVGKQQHLEAAHHAPSSGGLVFGVMFVGIFAVGGYRMYTAEGGSDAPIVKDS